MKPIMIIENNNNPLSLSEEFVTSNNKKAYLLGGIFTEFDIKNRNERVYTAPKFLPCLEELNDRITKLGVYGEFDHPDVFDTSLQRASHIVKEAVYNKEFNRVEGKIQLLSTYWGKEARALVEDQCPVFVSSRAAGVTENDGSVTLKKLFTYDIVADPGFGSARMSSINESLGFKNPENNFRIYEMSDESKINDIFNMNNNDFVTKEQLSSYSNYLVKEIDTIGKTVKEAMKVGKMDPKQLEKLLEYYEVLNNTNAQMVKYLDYLAETVQVVVNDNKNLREISEKLIEHNDYLAESLEKNIGYTEYVAEQVDKSIEYTEYIAEQVDKNIEYSEYIAEQLDKNIAYAEYIAENLDKNIAYAEYIAENVDKSIAYGEYVAESLDNAIAYSEYLAEHVEGNIAYSEYIAEHLDDNIGYSEYIAEQLDKTVGYAGMIAEKLNNNKVNEDASNNAIPTLEEWGFSTEDDVVVEEEEPIEDVVETPEAPIFDEEGNQLPTEEAPIITDETEEQTDFPTEEAPIITDDTEATIELTSEIPATIEVETPVFELPTTIAPPSFAPQTESQLTIQMDKLIAEAMKRKVVETSDLHFLKFLNKAQVDSYYSLTNEEQELVKLHINEKSYFNGKDVLVLMQEALAAKNETLEEKLIRLIPESVMPLWNDLNDTSKKSVLSQARLGYDLTTESSIEHFWYTRNLKKNETKKLVSHDTLIQEDKLSDSAMNSIMERFKNLS